MRNQFASFALFLVAPVGVFHSTRSGGQVAAAYHRATRPAAEAFAWKVQGRFMDDRAGKEISTGNAVLPGSLLEPLGASSAHSLPLLMADGRLDLVVAAVKPGQTAMMADFFHAKKVLANWNEQYYGWPMHDLLRAYLESFEAP